MCWETRREREGEREREKTNSIRSWSASIGHLEKLWQAFGLLPNQWYHSVHTHTHTHTHTETCQENLIWAPSPGQPRNLSVPGGGGGGGGGNSFLWEFLLLPSWLCIFPRKFLLLSRLCNILVSPTAQPEGNLAFSPLPLPSLYIIVFGPWTSCLQTSQILWNGSMLTDRYSHTSSMGSTEQNCNLYREIMWWKYAAILCSGDLVSIYLEFKNSNTVIQYIASNLQCTDAWKNTHTQKHTFHPGARCCHPNPTPVFIL